MPLDKVPTEISQAILDSAQEELIAQDHVAYLVLGLSITNGKDCMVVIPPDCNLYQACSVLARCLQQLADHVASRTDKDVDDGKSISPTRGPHFRIDGPSPN